MTLGELESKFSDTVAAARALSQERPSRELSLAITKAQEGLLWVREAIAQPQVQQSQPRA